MGRQISVTFQMKEKLSFHVTDLIDIVEKAELEPGYGELRGGSGTFDWRFLPEA